jgi:hypothetical protein
MSRPPVPDLPPDLPPEYAEAYRRGFERAYAEATGEPLPADRLEELAHAEGEAEVEVERTSRIEGLDGLLSAAPAEEYVDAPTPAPEPVPVSAAEPVPVSAAEEAGPAERPAWLVPAILAGLVATLLLGAYLAGLVFSSSVDDADVEAEEPDGVVIGDGTAGSGGGGNDGGGQSADPDAYQGRVDTVPVSASTASCIAPASVDAAGNEVTYEPGLAHDGDLTTAWRCPGDGVGESITLQLSQELQVAELGLVPGYAKTDPRSGADRYAENNRITMVRWTFPNGTVIEQELDGSPDNREMQTMRLRPVLANEVVLEVVSSDPGRRNTIAVSEVVVGTPAG